MTELKKFDSPKEFLEFNDQTLKNQYFEHFHLNKEFEDLYKGKGTLYDAFNILDNDGSNVIIVWVDFIYYVYAVKWNAAVLGLLSEKIQEAITEIKIFRGQKGILQDILGLMNINHEIINDRVIFSCKTVEKNIPNFEGHFDTGRIYEFKEILQLCSGYYQEDFKGKGSQTKEEITQSVYQGLLEPSIYTWNVDDQITSVARIINSNPDNAMIGGLFTRSDKRAKGYAHFLLYELTKNLLNDGVKKCGLLTEISNLGAMKVFEKVGYQKKYDWLNVRKLK